MADPVTMASAVDGGAALGLTAAIAAAGATVRYITAWLRRKVAAGTFAFLPDWMEPTGWRVYLWVSGLTLGSFAVWKYAGPFAVTLGVPPVPPSIDLGTARGWLTALFTVVAAVVYNEFAKHRAGKKAGKKKDPGT